MYELSIQSAFSAAHALRIGETRETLHGHDFGVTLTISGDTLDADGLLCDFHTIEEALELVIGPFRNQNLNEVVPFTKTNPTAELIAKHIADSLAPMMPDEVTILSVRVTEAVGCAATYKPPVS